MNAHYETWNKRWIAASERAARIYQMRRGYALSLWRKFNDAPTMEWDECCMHNAILDMDARRGWCADRTAEQMQALRELKYVRSKLFDASSIVDSWYRRTSSAAYASQFKVGAR